MLNQDNDSLPALSGTECAGKRKLYTVREVTTPVVSGQGNELEGVTATANPASGAPAAEMPPPHDPFLRAACEDDDGYDPYSDRREEPPLFEANPWA